MGKKFILVLAAFILGTSQLASAQQQSKAPIVGILTLASDDPLAKVLRDGYVNAATSRDRTLFLCTDL